MKRFVWPVYRPSVEWNSFYLAGKPAIGGERVKMTYFSGHIHFNDDEEQQELKCTGLVSSIQKHDFISLSV